MKGHKRWTVLGMKFAATRIRPGRWALYLMAGQDCRLMDKGTYSEIRSYAREIAEEQEHYRQELMNG